MTDYNEKERDDYVNKEKDKISCHIQAEYRIEYIRFINKLMDRMKMRSIERMLDAALEEVEAAGGLQI